MNRDVKRDGRALQRIVALLLALASLAERAGAVPAARRAMVLAILRPAEAAAWAFVLGTPGVSTGPGRDHDRFQDASLTGDPAGGGDGPAGLARLACSLRMLALLLAGWAAEALSPAAAPSPLRRAGALKRPHPGASWRGPPALPAPDTS